MPDRTSAAQSTADPVARLAALPTEQWADVLRDDQFRRWEAGRPLSVEDYLRRVPRLQTLPETVLDLIFGEVMLRERAGQRVELAHLLGRFPAWADAVRRQWQVHDALRTGGAPDRTWSLGGSRPRRDELVIPGYELLDELGSGGGGTVYRARQTALDRLVAVKLMCGSRVPPPKQLARFRQEAELIAKLQHPHVVQVFEVGESAGVPYLVMEFVPGGSLEARLTGEPWPVADAAALVETLARAVAAVHGCGIVHRDLKPGNVLIAGATGGAASDPKIADFGLAKFREQPPDRAGLTDPGDVVGTPRYMAPEQARSQFEAIGPATDVHALGLILYELLAGRPPFVAATVAETLAAVAYSDPVPLARINPAVPADLDAVCRMCLAKSPADRYPTANALADDLRRFRAGFPVAARAVGPVTRLQMWARRQPVVACLLVAVFAVLVAGFGVSSWQWWRADRAARSEFLAREQAETAWGRESAARHEAQIANAALTVSLHESGTLLARRLVSLAERAVADGRFADARRHLDECPPAARGWEWRHLFARTDVLRRVLDGHPDAADRLMPVAGAAVSRDGKRFATVSRAGERTRSAPDVRVWDAATGRLVARLDGHSCVAFSPRDDQLAAAGPNGTVLLWSALDGPPRALKGNGSPVHILAFSPDGGTLAAGTEDGAVCLWNIAGRTSDARVVTALQALGGVRCLAFSPDGTVLAAGRHRIHFWDVPKNQPVAGTSPSGSRPAPLQLTHPDRVFAHTLAFAGDGTLYTGGSDGVIRAWDWKAARGTARIEGHTAAVESLATLPGDGLVSAGHDGLVRVWDVPSRKAVAEFPGLGTVAVDPHTRTLLAASSNRRPTLWGYDPPRETTVIAAHTGLVTAATTDPRSGDLVTGGTDLAVRWHDPLTGRETRLPLKTAQTPFGLAFSPDGRWLAVGTGDRPDPARPGGLTVVDLRTGRETRPEGTRSPVVSVAFARDGSRFAAASLDGLVRVWVPRDDGFRPERTLVAHKNRATGLAFAPDGRSLATVGGDGQLAVWELETGRKLWSAEASAGLVHAVAYRPDGRSLATATRGGAVALWDAATGRELRTFAGHTGAVQAVAFSPDGTRLGSVGADGTTRLWDPDRGELVLSLKTHQTQVFVLTFGPDGRYLAAGGRDHAVRVYHAPAD